MFRNRSEAGIMLASKLRKYQNGPGIVLAVPRGGIPVACEVAKELGLPLEIVLTKKLVIHLIKNMLLGPPAFTIISLWQGKRLRWITRE